MPSKHIKRSQLLLPHHVWNRARRGRRMFEDDADRDEFLDILACRFSRSTISAGPRYRYSVQMDGVELFAFCLMTTHFHLIVWQKRPEALRRLMQSVISSYTRYFNKRHGTSGSLFSGPYRARPLTTRKDFRWAIAYVHDNHPSGPAYRYSSHHAYLDNAARPAWLNSATPLKRFGGVDGYRDYFSKRTERAVLNDLFFESSN